MVQLTKKILFLTFIFGFMLVIHKVWADGIDGETLLCNQESNQVSNIHKKLIIYNFEQKQAFTTYITKTGALNKIAKKGNGYYYISTSHYIGWCEGNSYRNNCHEFDRDTLRLKITKFGAPSTQYECHFVDPTELEDYIN